MTGFGVDIGQLSSLTGKVSGIGESITGAAGAVAGTGGGEFGHPQLNQVVSQLSGLLHEYLSGLGQSVNGMADHLHSTIQSYAATDSANAGSLGELTGGAVTGPTSATANPIEDFGSKVADYLPGTGLSGTGGSSGPFGLGDSPLAQ